MLARRRCCALAVAMLRWVRWVRDEARERTAHQGSLLRAELDGAEQRGEEAVEAAAEAERGTAELLEQVRELEESLAQQRRRTQQAQHRLAETEEQLQLQQMRQQHAQSPRSAGASRSASRSALAPAPAVLDEVCPHPHPGSHSYPHPGSV